MALSPVRDEAIVIKSLPAGETPASIQLQIDSANHLFRHKSPREDYV